MMNREVINPWKKPYIRFISELIIYSMVLVALNGFYSGGLFSVMKNIFFTWAITGRMKYRAAIWSFLNLTPIKVRLSQNEFMKSSINPK